MSGKSLTIHDEESGPVTIKMSESGRISLSDITAATIGDLGSWTDDTECTLPSTEQLIDMQSEVSVLRPWEDKSLMDKTDTDIQPLKEQSRNINCKFVESSNDSNSGDHLKQQLEDFYNLTEGPQWKRPRYCGNSELSAPEVLSSQNISTTSTTACNENMSDPLQIKTTEDSVYSALIQDNKVSGQYAYPSLSQLCHSVQSSNATQTWNKTDSINVTSTQTVWKPHQYSEIQPGRSTIGSISNFYQDHFKVSQSDQFKVGHSNQLKVSHSTHLKVSNSDQSEVKNAVHINLKETPSIFAPNDYFKTDPVTPNAKNPNQLPSFNIYDNMKETLIPFPNNVSNDFFKTDPVTPVAKRPNQLPSYNMYDNVKETLIPFPNSVSNDFFKTNLVTPVAKRPNQLPSYNVYDNVKENPILFPNSVPTDFFKTDPVTPVAKKPNQLATYNIYDSPGVESRFNESLSNLIGSPPPDSPLSKNPFFSDLQALLTNECKQDLLPKTLFGIHENAPPPVEKENIFVRERKIHDRFNDLQASHQDEVRNLSSFFRYQTAMIETERFRTLHENQYQRQQKNSVNRFYDNKIHHVIDRVERSVLLLENANKENSSQKMIIKPRPHLNREAIQLMENWYKSNIEHPYPTNTIIEVLANSGNVSVDQVKKWFANKRNRSQNTRTLTEIAMKKRKLGHLVGPN